jgi:tetratricopeptide (TPR) repeat protein
MKRFAIVMLWGWLALGARAVTPEVGQDQLRLLLKLPTISFQPDWTFDPEHGFSLGSGTDDKRAAIESLRGQLKFNDRDAELQQQLAELYRGVGDATNSRDAWTQAAEYYRKRVAAQPEDAVLLSGLGTSLEGIGHDPEAESYLRRAVETAPTQWKCRVALGRFLDDEAHRAVIEPPAPATGANNAPASDSAGPTAENSALALKWLDEAGDCFDRAVVEAPHEAEVYYRRATHRTLQTVIANRLREAGGTGDSVIDPFDGCFSTENLADLRHAATLSPADYRLAGAAAMFELYSVTVNKGKGDWSHLSWNGLPGKSQASIGGAITRLQDLSQNPNPETAAGSLEVLGILQGPILHEPGPSIANLERAVTLQPSRGQAWEVLVAMLAQTGRYDEMLTVCEDQLKHDESPEPHLLLAKAHEKLQQWDDSEEEARLAVSDDPNDPVASLSLGTLLLKRSRNDTDALSEADDWLSRSEDALKQVPPGRRNRQAVIDLTLTRGIYFALSGEIDTGRKWVQTVIDRDKDNEFARQILAAMDF